MKPMSRVVLALLAVSPWLSACDDGGGADSFDVVIRAEPRTGNAPLTVDLSTDDNAPVDAELSHAWTFGDGESAEGAEVEHVFTAPGTYEVTVRVEGGGASGTATETIEVAPSADLVVSQVGFEPQRARVGEAVNVTWGLRNAGADVVGRYQIAIFLSRDDTFDADDIELRRVPRANDAASEAPAGLEAEVTLPDDLESGDWRVGVVADPDGMVGDANRGDNVAVGSFPLQVTNPTDTGPDLSICGVGIPAFESVPAGQTPVGQLGDQLPVTVCLANLGNEPTPKGSFTLYLSRDESHDDEDVQVGARAEIAIGQEDREEFSSLVDLPLDIEPGTWFLLAVADPGGELDEQREDNNEDTWPGPFELAEPGQVEGIDLVAARLEVEGDKAFWGQTLPGTLLLQNRGDTAVERPALPVRVLAEPVDGGAPVTLDTVNHLGGVPASGEVEVEIPIRVKRTVEPGRYRLAVLVDPTNAVDDVNPGNNRRTLQREFELGGEPSVDVGVSAVTLSAETIDAGDELTVDAAVANIGDDPSGAVEAVVVFSADDALDADDVVVDAFDLDALDGGEMREIQRSFSVPAELDQQVPSWRVAVVLDPEGRLDDLDPENNVSFAEVALVVEGASGGCAEDDREENDTPQTAAPLEPGSYADLGACDDADWFAVAVPAGSVLEVAVRWDAESGAASLRLTDAEGMLLREADGADGALSAVEAQAEVDRTLLLEFSGAGAGLQYDLDVGVAPAAEGADLRVRAVTPAPAVAEPGALLDVRFELVNLGQAEAPAGEVTVALVGAGDEQALGTVETPAVPGGAAAEVIGPVALPEDVAPGRYRLVVRAGDAEGSGAVRVDPDRACAADDFEPNGSPHEAGGQVRRAATVEPGAYDALFACRGDDDWYAVSLEEGDRLEVTIEFVPLDGDLDLAIYAPDGETLIDDSTGLQATEQALVRRAQEAGDYLVRVFLRGGGESAVNTYSMNVDVQDAGACDDDDFEPNGPDAAVPLPDGRHDLFLCPGDEDWFQIPIPAGNIVSFRLFGGAAGVDIALFDPRGDLVEESNRRIVHTAEVNGNFQLRVQAPEAVERVMYALEVTGVSGVDLTLEALRLSGERVPPAGDLLAEAVVGNLRGDAVADVPVVFYLSEDDTFDDDDVRVGETLVDVGGADRVPVEVRLRLPADVPPGDAFIVGVVDPDREAPDVQPGNNAESTPLVVVAACEDDDPRTNEGPRTATPVDEADGAVEGGVICPHTEDWFALETGAGEVVLRLSFAHDAGDLDLVVRDEGGALLGESRTTDDEEVVVLDLEAPATLLVGVDGFLDAANSYTLSWTLPE